MEPIIQKTTPDVVILPQAESPKPKFWKRYLSASFVLFIIVMGYFVRAAYVVQGQLSSAVLVGSIIVSLGAAILFYFTYWIISLLGRRFGQVVAVILWLVIIGVLVGSLVSFLNRSLIAANSPMALQEDSIYLPPGTDLSILPSYLQVDKSRIVNMPGGSMSIPRSAIKFVMSYNDCLSTEDTTAQTGCATKYSLERSDVSLCKSLIRSNDPVMQETIVNSQEDCITQYAFIHMDPSLCDTLTKWFIKDSCFGGIVSQIKDSNQCKTIFKTPSDIKDCTDGVKRNREIEEEKNNDLKK